MEPRDVVRNAAHAYIRRNIAPQAAYDDIRSPGLCAELSSPVLSKYGIDISSERIYDSFNADAPMYCGAPLFSGCSRDSGYLNFRVSPEAYGIFVAQVNKRYPDIGVPVDAIRVGGRYAEFAHAQLLCIARTTKVKGFVMPCSNSVRNALWLCLTMGASPYLQKIAVNAVAAATQRHLTTGGDSVCEAAARAMAALIYNSILDKPFDGCIA